MDGSCCGGQEEKCLDVISIISANSPRTRIIPLVKPDEIPLAIAGLDEGAYQYIRLPSKDREIRLIIETALKDRPAFGLNRFMDEGVFPGMREMVGRSERMVQMYDMIEQAARVDIPILITGETGTGKELVAASIHRLSQRNKNTYLPVNLGSFPKELVANELFGHDRGSYTGAQGGHPGVFERADKGTLFLDEINSVDDKTAISLLRMVEENKVSRLGGKRDIEVDVRLIAATNSDLDEMVRTGKFRKDLFYRLEAFRIDLPPLRERGEDIGLLTEEFVLNYSRGFNKRISRIHPEIYSRFNEYSWPGNIRELMNVVLVSVISCNEPELCLEHLPQRMNGNEDDSQRVTFKIGTSLNDVEREMVLRAMADNDNNRTRAAEVLGISRRSLYSKFVKHNIKEDFIDQKPAE